MKNQRFMVAQAYFEDDEGDPRVQLFIGHQRGPCSSLIHNTPEDADRALNALGVKRRGEWDRMDWGLEATVEYL